MICLLLLLHIGGIARQELLRFDEAPDQANSDAVPGGHLLVGQLLLECVVQNGLHIA